MCWQTLNSLLVGICLISTYLMHSMMIIYRAIYISKERQSIQKENFRVMSGKKQHLYTVSEQPLWAHRVRMHRSRLESLFHPITLHLQDVYNVDVSHTSIIRTIQNKALATLLSHELQIQL